MGKFTGVVYRVEFAVDSVREDFVTRALVF